MDYLHTVKIISDSKKKSIFLKNYNLVKPQFINTIRLFYNNLLKSNNVSKLIKAYMLETLEIFNKISVINQKTQKFKGYNVLEHNETIKTVVQPFKGWPKTISEDIVYFGLTGFYTLIDIENKKYITKGEAMDIINSLSKFLSIFKKENHVESIDIFYFFSQFLNDSKETYCTVKIINDDCCF